MRRWPEATETEKGETAGGVGERGGGWEKMVVRKETGRTGDGGAGEMRE